MSSMSRQNSRSREDNKNPSCNGIVRRMVSLPRNILEGVSRAMGHGYDVMVRDRRTHIFPPRPQPPPFLPPHFPLYPPQYHRPETTFPNDEWSFLDKFEQDYGTMHPFFYACRFGQALKIAQDEKKFMFLYLHSVDHPFVAEFCRGTLCSEVVVQFIDANFVSWGGLCDRGEGLQMSGILRPASFPFCAVIAPATTGDNIAVLQQIEGPVSPAELVEILQRTLEEQGVAFGSGRAIEEERIRADRRLREEQDAAYFAALKLDQEKEMLSSLPKEQQQTVQKPLAPATANAPSSSSSSNKGFNQWPKHNPTLIKPSKVGETTPKFDNKQKSNAVKAQAKGNQVTQILIRFPNGERRESNFCATDKVQAIYKYIDSIGLPGIKNYRLISSFPRKVFGADQMSITLKDAGLHPKATLFLELI